MAHNFGSDDEIERQADLFATNLLMPEFLIQDIIDSLKPSIKSIQKLSEKCKTSFTATAIRFVELTKKSVCLIVSENGKVCYSFMSKRMKKRNLDFIKKNSKIAPDTITYQVINDGTLFNENYISKDAHLYDWFDCDSEKWTTEEVMYIKSINKVFTLIHF